jgi:hypothetical protein
LVSYKCPPNPPAQTVTLSYKFQLNQRTEIASIQTHFCSRFKGTHGSRNPAGKRPTNTRTRTKPPNPMRGSIKFCHDERRKWLWPGSNPVGQAGKQLIIDHRLPQFDMICCWCQETLVGLGLQLGMLAHAHDTVITSLCSSNVPSKSSSSFPVAKLYSTCDCTVGFLLLGGVPDRKTKAWRRDRSPIWLHATVPILY